MSIVSVIRATAAVLALAGTWQVHAEGHHWSYGKHGGPGEWGTLDKAFASCRIGTVQSPIDIRGAKAADLPAITFDYKPVPLKLIDNGHTIQVNYPPGSTIDVGGTRYELVQFHFHKPSEEKIDGKAHAMVAHLVHKGSDGALAVVAVLLDLGSDNPTLRAVWSHLPKRKDREVATAATIDAAALLPEDKGYYTFAGSLTTPPCSEGVRWFVLKTAMTVTANELTAFAKLYPMNARPTQPLNGRTLEATR